MTVSHLLCPAIINVLIDIFDRRDDVPKCRGRDYVLRVLLDSMCNDIPRMAEGSENDGLIFLVDYQSVTVTWHVLNL